MTGKEPENRGEEKPLAGRELVRRSEFKSKPVLSASGRVLLLPIPEAGSIKRNPSETAAFLRMLLKNVVLGHGRLKRSCFLKPWGCLRRKLTVCLSSWWLAFGMPFPVMRWRKENKQTHMVWN